MDQRRVLWLGALASAAQQRVRETAKELMVVDQTRALPGKLRTRSEGGAPVAFRPHWCDVVVVPNIRVLEDQGQRLMAAIGDALAEDGVVLLGVPAGTHDAYQALYALASSHAEHVAMFGRSAFCAWSFSRFDASGDAGKVVVDGSVLSPTEERAEWYFALTSGGGTAFAGEPARAIIRVSSPEGDSVEAPRRPSVLAAEDMESDVLETMLRTKATECRRVSRELAAVQALCRDLIERDRTSSLQTLAHVRNPPLEATAQVGVEQLHQRLAARDRLVSRLQVELAEVELRTRSADDLDRQLQEENRRLREAVVIASSSVEEVDALRETAQGLRTEVNELRAQLSEAQAIRTAHKQAISVLEKERNSARKNEEESRRTLQELRERLAPLSPTDPDDDAASTTLPGSPSDLLES